MRLRHTWRLALAAVIVAGLAFQFYRSDLHALAALRTPSTGPLALAFILGIASYFCFLLAWQRLQGRVQSWPALGRIWFASLFARYAPGGVWQGAVRVGGAHFAGDSKRVVLQRYFAEQGLACFSATTLALVLLPFAHTSPGLPITVALAGIAAAALAAATIGPKLGFALQWDARAVVAMLGGHVAMASGFAAFVTALSAASDVGDAVSFMVMFLVAGVAGLLAVFVPAGIGVREAMLAGLLAPQFGVAPAIAIAVAARLWLLVCEIGACGVWFLATHRLPVRPSAAIARREHTGNSR
jgi:hypothetical protein